MLISLGLAFTNYDLLSKDYEYVGTENFDYMFNDDIRYDRSVAATTKYVVWAVPVALGVCTICRGLAQYKATRCVFVSCSFYAPSVVGGSVAVAVMWRQIFGNDGVVNEVLLLFSVEPYRWLGNPKTAIWTLIFLAVWQFGSPMLIFLAGLKQIPESLYEAASIDGANGLQKFYRITLPLLTPIIFFNLIMQTIPCFQAVYTSIHHLWRNRTSARHNAAIHPLSIPTSL